MTKTQLTKLAPVITVLFMLFINCTDRLIEQGNRNLSLGDYQRAVYYFSKSVDKNPDCFDSRLGLGKALMQQLAAVSNQEEIWNGCLINLEAARTLNPSDSLEKLLSIAWHQRAGFFLEKKDTVSAIHALLKSIEYDKKNTSALNAAGILYFYRGDTRKAFSLFSLVMAMDTLSPNGFFNTGMIYWSYDDCENAKKIWTGALKKFPKNDELLNWTAIAEKTCSSEK